MRVPDRALVLSGSPRVANWRGSHAITRPEQLPKGKILGMVTLEACIPTEELELDLARTSEQKFGDFRPGRWARKVTNPVVFAEPIAYQASSACSTLPTTS